jgi:arylsulfatase A-like enzyme
MLTGRYPSSHGLRDDGVKLAPAVPTLAESFRRNGYHTLAVVSHV